MDIRNIDKIMEEYHQEENKYMKTGKNEELLKKEKEIAIKESEIQERENGIKNDSPDVKFLENKINDKKLDLNRSNLHIEKLEEELSEIYETNGGSDMGVDPIDVKKEYKKQIENAKKEQEKIENEITDLKNEKRTAKAEQKKQRLAEIEKAKEESQKLQNEKEKMVIDKKVKERDTREKIRFKMNKIQDETRKEIAKRRKEIDLEIKKIEILSKTKELELEQFSYQYDEEGHEINGAELRKLQDELLQTSVDRKRLEEENSLCEKYLEKLREPFKMPPELKDDQIYVIDFEKEQQIELPEEQIELQEDGAEQPKDEIELQEDGVEQPKDEIDLQEDGVEQPKDEIDLQEDEVESLDNEKVKILYSAKKDCFFVTNVNNGNLQKIIERKKLPEIDKNDIIEKIGNDNITDMDISILQVLEEYDSEFNTDKAQQYLKIMRKELKTKEVGQKRMDEIDISMIYNLRGMYDKDSKISKEERLQILRETELAKKQGKATVEKGAKVAFLGFMDKIKSKAKQLFLNGNKNKVAILDQADKENGKEQGSDKKKEFRDRMESKIPKDIEQGIIDKALKDAQEEMKRIAMNEAKYSDIEEENLNIEDETDLKIQEEDLNEQYNRYMSEMQEKGEDLEHEKRVEAENKRAENLKKVLEQKKNDQARKGTYEWEKGNYVFKSDHETEEDIR